MAYGRHLINCCSTAEFLCEAFFLLSDPISVSLHNMTYEILIPQSTVTVTGLDPERDRKMQKAVFLTLRS